VKISTDAGIVGWGEMLKDDAKACAAGALEVGKYLVGKDPLRVVDNANLLNTLKDRSLSMKLLKDLRHFARRLVRE
jgi:L-alanine-DL-glutamate epimerase-like enolase superfamily enzyme